MGQNGLEAARSIEGTKMGDMYFQWEGGGLDKKSLVLVLVYWNGGGPCEVTSEGGRDLPSF